MKTIFFALLYSAMVCTTYAQTATYTVLRVEPAEKVTLNGKNITVGTTLKATDKVEINSPDGYIKVYNGKSSAYIKRSGEVSKVLGESITAKSIGGSRGEFESKEELALALSVSPFVIIDTFKLSIPKTLYVLEKWTSKPVGNFFYLTYDYRGREIVKYLRVGEDNSFIIDMGIFVVGKTYLMQSEAKNYQLSYSDSEGNATPVANMNLKILRTEDIRAEIEGILNAHKQLGDSYQDTVGYIAHYIEKNYGRIDAIHLKEWLYKTFRYK